MLRSNLELMHIIEHRLSKKTAQVSEKNMLRALQPNLWNNRKRKKMNRIRNFIMMLFTKYYESD
jgi:alcohol dehydrogenase YqhD (iron-dependent ADH family)